jgi:hypothetical protein
MLRRVLSFLTQKLIYVKFFLGLILVTKYWHTSFWFCFSSSRFRCSVLHCSDLLWFSYFPLFQGQTPLFPRIFGHEAGGYDPLLNIES